MANYSKHKVASIIENREGLTKIRLSDGSRAYNIIQNCGEVAIGDEVIVNTTAVDLNLGTGGWHFVLWNLKYDSLSTKSSGHIMKLRYSALQFESGVAEEFNGYTTQDNISGCSVIAAPLFSQVAPIATFIKNKNSKLKIALAISDSASLPLAISDLMIRLKELDLVDTSITFGQAYGGDIEAINIFTALLSARHIANADIVIVTMGPGIVGTGTQFGYSGIDVAYHLDSAKSLEAKTYGVLRASSADPRERHQGISHHSITTFSKATHEKHNLGLIDNDEKYTKIMRDQLEKARIYSSHNVVEVQSIGIIKMMQDIQLEVSSMGRPADQDELFFESACASAQLAIAALEN